MGDPKESRLGDNWVRIEEDVFFVRAGGEVTVEIAQGVVQILRQVKERHGRFFIIGDLKDAGTMVAGARRIFAEFAVHNAPLAVAFYRANLMVRGINALLLAAANLLGKQSLNLRQFGTEQEARAWIMAERMRLLTPELR